MIFFHVNLRVCMWFIKLNMKCCLVQHSLHKFDHHAYLGILLCCLVTVVRRRTGRACLVSWTSCWQGCLFRNEMDPFTTCRQECFISLEQNCMRFFWLLAKKSISSLTDIWYIYIYVILSTGYQNSQRFAASSTTIFVIGSETSKAHPHASGSRNPRTSQGHSSTQWNHRGPTGQQNTFCIMTSGVFSDDWSLEWKYKMNHDRCLTTENELRCYCLRLCIC